MKNQLGLLFLLITSLTVACSTNEGKFGTTNANGGAGGTIVGPDAGEVPLKDWTTEDGGTTTSDGGTSEAFGNLFAPGNAYYDPNDPCTQVVKWVPDFTIAIVNGTLVGDAGKVYMYDNTGGGVGNCNETISYTFAACTPSAPADWCKTCWILQTLTCDFSTTTTTGTGGATSTGGTSGTGGTTSTGT